MLWNDTLDLIHYTTAKNSLGDDIKAPVKTRIYCNRKSVRQNEFYQAMTTGLKAETMFEVRAIDYNGQRVIEHGGKQYNVIRTYDKNGEVMELVCSGLVHNANT